MKKAFLLIVIPALLVALGFAQTPAASSNTDQTNVRGCLGGSDDNYTIKEDNTGQIFKITTSSVDLKLHLGHDVKLVGHKASGTVSSGTADNSLAVTELSMISEHCAGAAAAPVATVSSSPETVITPAAPVAAATAAASVSAPTETATPPASALSADTAAPSATVNTPAAETAAPAATINTPAAETAAPAATIKTPAAETAAPAAAVDPPAATVSPSSETVSTPAAATAHPTRPSAHPRRQLATPAAAATPAATVSPQTADAATSAATASKQAADAATPAATATTPPETDSTPAAAATTPTGKGRSLWLFIPFVVLLIALGTLVPLLNRWRKRKLLEQTSAQNLSLTHKPSSDPGKSDTPVVVHKAA
jgi:hypothetical protein